MAKATKPPLTKIKLTATAGGDVPLTAFSATFRLHDIPTAHLKVAVGRAADGSGSADGGSQVAKRTPVTVTLDLEGEEAPGKSWGGSVEIFDGVLNRPSYSRGFGAAGLVYIADHWLAGLASGTKVASVLMARGISDLFIRRVPVKALETNGKNYPDMTNAASELWKNGIKPLLEFAAKQGLGLEMAASAEAGADIIETLNRMDGEIDEGGLGFNDLGDFGEVLGSRLGEWVIPPESGITAWDTIINLGNRFGFKVVPNVKSATCAPVHPTGGDAYVTIKADEYFDCSVASPPMTREFPISQVQLFGNDGIASLMTKQRGEGDLNIMGLYASGEEKGQILVLPAPPILNIGGTRWLGAEPKKVIPIFQNGLSSNSDEFTPPQATGEEYLNLTAAGNAFAHMMYIEHTFGSSTMRLTGRLRFDIGPGSLVEVEVIGNRQGGGSSNSLFGVVNAVTVNIDAEVPSASTSFEIGSIHSKSDRGSMPSGSPLFNSSWKGTYLVPQGG